MVKPQNDSLIRGCRFHSFLVVFRWSRRNSNTNTHFLTRLDIQRRAKEARKMSVAHSKPCTDFYIAARYLFNFKITVFCHRPTCLFFISWSDQGTSATNWFTFKRGCPYVNGRHTGSNELSETFFSLYSHACLSLSKTTISSDHFAVFIMHLL
jgi:hypothetical protein